MNKIRGFFQEEGSKRWRINRIIAIVAIVIPLIIFLFERYSTDKSRAQSALEPVITFNTLRDANKEAPGVFRGATLNKYGEDGFRFKWEKGKGWRAIEWKLRYKNFENTENYVIYYRGKAKKEGRVTLNLIDDNESFVSIHIDLNTYITKNTIYLSTIEECLVKIKENGNEKVVCEDIDYFHWERIEKVQLERFWENNEDNEVIFEELMMGFRS